MKTAIALLIASLAAPAATVTLTGFDGATDGNFFVLPYTLTIDGTPHSAACYDFFDTVYAGETWEANLFTLDEAADHGQFSAVPDALAKYEEVAVLYFLYPGADQIELSHEIWNVFDPGQFTATSAMATYEAAALAAIPGFDFSHSLFVEGVIGGVRVQAFVIDPAPEPYSAILMGLALIGLGYVRRRG